VLDAASALASGRVGVIVDMACSWFVCFVS
jgi:hypothetical protein